MTTVSHGLPGERLTTAEADIFRTISLLLLYPEEVEPDELTEATRVVEKLNDEVLQHDLLAFLEYVRQTSLLEWTQAYVRTFDFSDSAALYLTYGKNREDRERGPELVRLKQTYGQLGYTVTETELPDYLPLFLEFVSIAPRIVVRELLTEYKHAIQEIGDALHSVQSPYAHLMRGCQRAVALFLSEGGGLA